MNSPNYHSFLDHLRISLSLSLTVCSLLGLLVLIRMPFFLGNPLDLLIFCLLIPVILGCLVTLILFLIERKVPSVNLGSGGLQLPFAYIVSFLLLFVAVFLSGFIYLFISNNLILHFVLLLVYFLVWLFTLSKIGQVGSNLSSRHLALTAVCLFISSIALYIGLTPVRNFKVSSEVFIFGVDAATWSVIDPLIEKGRLPNIAELKSEGSYGVLKSMEPILSPIIWTTIATGKVGEKHGIKDFYSTQESLQTRRIWDTFEAQGMRIGIFKWLITWPPRKVNGFIIPDILARDDSTFPPEYSAINSLRIAEKTHYSMDVRTYAKLTWSLMNMGLRMSTLREIGWDFFLDRLQGGDSISQYPLKRKAELLINQDVFIYLLKKYKPEFVTFYDNGVDTLSHRYWKYHEPKYFPDVTPEEVHRYGNVIPNYYELIDKTLKNLMDHFSNETLVVVVSDHGQQASNKIKETHHYPKISKVLELMELDSIVYGITVADRTYIRLKASSHKEILDKVKKQLEGIEIVETGKRLFDVASDESALIVEMGSEAVDFNYHVQINQRNLMMEEITYKDSPYSGMHHINGILLMKGPNVHSGVKIQDASILDVTPTILYLQKMPISQETDGKILFSAIPKKFQKINPPRLVPESVADKVTPSQNVKFDKQVEERLRSLGYVQ
ncbi:MAG TPA: alkaline phosphatase family protein [Thermodesulfobacteriota bacterium]|nr:alkaline phosphatase family protein [Thermodesulfobacteriota bacterium]